MRDHGEGSGKPFTTGAISCGKRSPSAEFLRNGTPNLTRGTKKGPQRGQRSTGRLTSEPGGVEAAIHRALSEKIAPEKGPSSM